MSIKRAGIVAVSLLVALPFGAAMANYAYRDGTGTLQQIFSFVCQAATICPAQVIIDSSGNEKATPSNPVVVGGSNNGAPKALSVDASGNLNVNATVSASVSGFQPSATGARGTPVSVTTSDSSGPLPTGAVVAVSNIGSNPMYCNVNGVAATASDQPITAGGGWFAFTIPSGITTLHCIAVGGNTTANMVGGSGLPTGTAGVVAGGGTGANVNVAQWNGVGVGSPTIWGIAPTGSDVIGVNANILNSSLPTGAATQTTLAAVLSALGSPFQAGGTIGNTTFAATQSGSWTTTVVQGTGTNLHMVCDSGCSSSTSPADESAFTFGTTSQSPVGGVYQTTATSNALTNGQMGAWQFTAQRAGFINLRNAAGTEIGTATTPLVIGGPVANGAVPVGNPIFFAGWDGTDIRAISTDGSGHLIVNINSAQTIGVTGTFWQATQPVSAAALPLPAGAATSALQGTNSATTAHTCAITGFSELGCLGQVDDDIKSPVAVAAPPYGIIGGVINGADTYNTIAASQTAQALTGGSGGATGDYLSHCVAFPTSTSPGVVTILDNSTTIFAFPGGSTSTSNLVPFTIPVGAVSTSGAWKVTTGANISVTCVGKFH